MTYNDLRPGLREAYKNLDRAAKKALLELDGNVLRFKGNKCVQFYVLRSKNPSLNDLIVAAKEGGWPKSHLRKFYRMMGYSLDGYLDIFGD